MKCGCMSSCSYNILAIALTFIHTTLLVACTGGGPETGIPAIQSGGNRPPVVTSAIILDAPISQAVPATVQIQAEDPEREPITYQYQWHVNDVPVLGQTSATLPPTYFHRGQRVSVVIVPSDSVQAGQPYTTKAIVGNTPPFLSKVELQSADGGTRVEATAEAKDPDHDRVDLTYRWFHGEQVIQESEESLLSTKGLDTRLPIVVEVLAHDSESVGKPLRSSPFRLDNHAPSIVSVPPVTSGENVYDYVVKAVDEDGDPVTFQLEKGPRGMTVDENTGHLHWVVPTDHAGVVHVKVLVKDAPGSIAYQEFDLTLSHELPVTKPAA